MPGAAFSRYSMFLLGLTNSQRKTYWYEQFCDSRFTLPIEGLYADGRISPDGSVMVRRTKRSLCKRSLLQKTKLSPTSVPSLVSFPHQTISKSYIHFKILKYVKQKKVVLNIQIHVEILFCFSVQYFANTHKSSHKKQRNNQVVP